MKKKKKELNNSAKLSLLIVAIVTGLSFLMLASRIVFLSTSKEVEGTNLKYFASQRTSRKDALVAKRGTIYDINGNVIAQNISSYTLIAYLNPRRTTNPKKPQHIVDPEGAAKLLAPVLDMTEEQLLKYLTKKNIYQTEFGNKGKGLTELKKDEIVALGIKGIDFIETQKRYYPYGDFLSYTIGYAKEKPHPDDKNKIILVGEMGLEKHFDKELSGTDGYNLYQKDRKGYKIPGTREVTVAAKDGNDIYLTIDVNIQLFLEQALNKSRYDSRWDWTSVILADAKDGKMLAMSSDPSFNPNKRDMTSYLDLNVGASFEPGSTMKVFSYMAAMEKGIYNGSDKYLSGVYKTADGTEIGDWKRSGWGHISFDQGFSLSSNTAIISLIKKGITASDLREYYAKLGFGAKTGIELPGEVSGKMNFKYETEILNAGFGQGLTTTAIQYVKAMSAVTNGGVVVNPYLIEKIVNSNTAKVIYQAKKEEGEKVASSQTVSKITDLMRQVVEGNPSTSTGYPYYMEGYKLAAKTGTAQVAKENGRGYSTNVIKSLVGFFPYDNPKVIVYIATRNPRDKQTGSEVSPMKTITNDIVKNISSYLNIYDGQKEESKALVSYVLPSLINKDVKEAVDKFNSLSIKTIVLGTGTKVIKQYPKATSKVSNNDRVILLTNNLEGLVMPKILGLSHKEAKIICTYINKNCIFDGNGYVTMQNIEVGRPLNTESQINLTLSQREIN